MKLNGHQGLLFMTIFGILTGEINRSFYRYAGYIELIQFKEYYRMPRGHEHISFVFSGAFSEHFS